MKIAYATIIFFIALISISVVSAELDDTIQKIGDANFNEEFTLEDGQYVSLPFNELYKLDIGILPSYPETTTCSNQICNRVAVYLRIGPEETVTSMSYKHQPDWELASVEASTFKLTLLDLEFEGPAKVQAKFNAEEKDIAPLMVDVDQEFMLIQNQEANLEEKGIKVKLLGLDDEGTVFLRVIDNYGEESIIEYSYKTSQRYAEGGGIMSCGKYYYKIACFDDTCLYLDCFDYSTSAIIREAKATLIFGKEEENLEECSSDADCGVSENPCVSYICSGTPKKCIEGIIFNCVNDDNCCPTECSHINDNDCKESAVCVENELKYYTCPDGTNISWCACIANKWECVSSPESQCPAMCAGCLYNSDCLPVGIRTDSKYCGLNKTLMTQKSKEEICTNSYECQSNFCLGNKCVSQSLLQKIIDWFKRMFDFI